MLDGESKRHASIALASFRKTKVGQLKLASVEKRTKRQVLDTLRRKFETLQAEYLRIPATTYEGWLTYGPKDEWEEGLAAVRDDAIGDRLGERCAEEKARD